jgi:hypothetical protein
MKIDSRRSWPRRSQRSARIHPASDSDEPLGRRTSTGVPTLALADKNGSSSAGGGSHNSLARHSREYAGNSFDSDRRDVAEISIGSDTLRGVTHRGRLDGRRE